MLTMYSTTWCGYCHRLASQLDRAGIAYTVVDIERDDAAAAYVRGVNGGNQTVPTVLFPDGSALTNPSIIEVLEQLDYASAGEAAGAPESAGLAGAGTVTSAASGEPAPADDCVAAGDSERFSAISFRFRAPSSRCNGPCVPSMFVISSIFSSSSTLKPKRSIGDRQPERKQATKIRAAADQCRSGNRD